MHFRYAASTNRSPTSIAIVLASIMCAGGGCGDAKCPSGWVRMGNLCKLQGNDAGSANGDSASASSSSGVTGVPGMTAGTTAAGGGAIRGAAAPNMSMAGNAGADRNGTAGSIAGAQSIAAGVGAVASAAGSGGGSAMTSTTGCPNNPVPEQCDNQDNDCDGNIDEMVTRPCGMTIGECKAGSEACHAGSWTGTCEGEVKPTAEVCDDGMKDENCNGIANESCGCNTGQTQPCGNPMSPCKQGTLTCTNGRWGTDCVGEVKGSPETCDGADNDCDGLVDDGPSLCTGTKNKCVAGRCVQCTSADASACSSQPTSVCHVNYCDTNLGECKQRTADDHSACSLTSGDAGRCNNGSCVGCIDDGDCMHIGQPSKFCDPTSRTCVSCYKSSQCGRASDMACTREHICEPACGNGQLDTDIGEQCDPSDPSGKWNEWNCHPQQCRPLQYLFTECQTLGASSPDCGGTGYCDSNRCYPTCSGATSAMPDPYECVAPNGRIGHCVAGVCIIRCDGTFGGCPVTVPICMASSVPPGAAYCFQ
jgi:hypothetical protein